MLRPKRALASPALLSVALAPLYAGCEAPGRAAVPDPPPQATAHKVLPLPRTADAPPAPSERVSAARAPTGHAERPTPPGGEPELPGGSGPTPLTLEELINRALAANRGLADVRDGVTSARYSLRAAESAFQLRLFPRGTAALSEGVGDFYRVGMELRQDLATGTRLSLTPEVGRTGDDYTSSLRATVRQPLLRGTDPEFVLSAVDAAHFAERRALRALHLARVDTVLATVAAAYQAVRQGELLRLTEDSAARLAGHAEAARARERAGLASSIDVFRATLQYNQAQDDLTAAREAYEEALDGLRILLALPLTAPLAVTAPLEAELFRIDEAEALAIALESRVELDQADDDLAEAERRSRVAHHATLPDLDVTLSYTQLGRSPDFGGSLDFGDDVLTVSLLTTSDLSRVAEYARYGQSRLAVAASQRGRELRRDQVAREVRRRLRELLRAEERIAIQRDQIDQAGGQLELARLKFSRGLTSNFDVVDAESALRRAETSLVDAVVDYIVGTYRFRAALGTLLERPPGV